MNTEQLSMLEVAIELLNQKKTPQLITSLIQEVLELKGLDDPNGVLATQLYIDITTSSSFVFCGEGKWDLKTRQSLEVFDRDGSFFNTGEEYEDEDETIELDDYNIDEEEIEKEAVAIEWDINAAEKGGYEHFMFKEIMEETMKMKKMNTTMITIIH